MWHVSQLFQKNLRFRVQTGQMIAGLVCQANRRDTAVPLRLIHINGSLLNGSVHYLDEKIIPALFQGWIPEVGDTCRC